ncbi:MAG: class I SAM-dependent methyltransferase [Methylocystaceae bacterium]|jgi:2-polyprenyl-3-methyl-5-hydroxy-6-metoxy-1,4-benzoquinol methylase|nr:class I SAM-dependent methyltransferase [Methylocystaceae bacterium]
MPINNTVPPVLSTPRTREPQYQECVEAVSARGFERLGLRSSQSWHDDPKHILFRLSRYKFVAKMLAGSEHVLEIGCGDAFGTRIVQQEVKSLSATDFDALFIDDVKARMVDRWRFPAFTHDLLAGPVPGSYDGIFALDVLEHILPKDEKIFLSNAFASLSPVGVGIIGMPSLESQTYASPTSRAGHVNCKSMPALKSLMQNYFHNVFMFSMNDEVVHTGYYPMAHYVLALGANRK